MPSNETPRGTPEASRKVILITGCSSGIGLDAALTLHARGWLVLATCRKDADCARLNGVGLESFRLDYEDKSSIHEAFNEAMRRSGGRLDALFNNGAYAIPGAVEDLPTEALRQIFEANFFGWHELTRLAIPVMRQKGDGRIIQNSSVLGFAALRLRGAYNATKFALEGLTDTMRLELKGSGIKVVLIEPGPIRTKIRENSYPHFQKWISWKDARLEEIYRKVLIPRLTAIDPPKDRFELMPDAVTAVLIDALESDAPRIRYRVTTATKLMGIMKRLLTSRSFDRLASRI
jgi:NAD(P)-dependent dehydrogenase (short-subunit alcohol dehydrogenase family)